MAFTRETVRQIWDDRDGERIEVGPDADSLGLVEIRLRSEDNKILARITMPAEQADMVAAAIGELTAEMRARSGKE